jgi:D-inositol-3-phosphate glycosyltransferase
LGHKVILHTHFIPNEKVAAYFCASDLVVQPYRDASQSGVTQVAYHFGVPMVVTNVGALPEMVPHKVAGLVVKPDHRMVAKAICQFYSEGVAGQLREGVEEQKKGSPGKILLMPFLKLQIESSDKLN